jgi:predicted O-methyltransferase YrrM
MKARELFEEIKPLWEKYDLKKAEPFLTELSEGSRNDIENKEEAGYYQFLPPLIEYLKPKQVLELGGAMGASALMMLSTLPSSSTLYSVTLEEKGLEFSFVKENYPNFVPIVGDDLNLKVWPKDLSLRNTDLWFLDSEHTFEQLNAEIELYKPFWKEGTVLLVDDIHLNEEMFKGWLRFPGSKFDATAWLHWSGFGIVVI